MIPVFIEMLFIILLFLIPSNQKANLVHTPIEIPDDVKFTIVEDFSFYSPWEGEDYFVPGGTVSKPYQINYDNVVFVFDEEKDIRYSVKFENLKEQDQLLRMKDEVERENKTARMQIMLPSIILGVLVSVGWFIVGAILTKRYIYRQSTTHLAILHVSIFLTIFIILVIYGYLFISKTMK